MKDFSVFDIGICGGIQGSVTSAVGKESERIECVGPQERGGNVRIRDVDEAE